MENALYDFYAIVEASGSLSLFIALSLASSSHDVFRCFN